MVGKNQKPKAKAQKRGNTIIAIVVGVMAFIIFTIGIIFYIAYQLSSIPKAIGEFFLGGGAQASSSALLQPVDCGNGTTVPKIYLPNIKQAAAQYLNGDEAALIAVIAHESSFDPKAMSNTGAVGIAQFTADTARRVQKKSKQFTNLPIITVPRADTSKERRVTSAEKATFLKDHANSGRLQPVPSLIWMAAEVRRGLDAQGGNLREAYAINYHTIGKNGEYKDAAYAAADKVAKTYEDLKKNGGCKALKDSPGKIGEDLRKASNIAF